MPDPALSLEAALDYLRRYGTKYSVEALVENLRQQGASEEVLDEAVRMYREWRRQADVRGCWRALLWVVLIGVVVVVVAVLLLIGLCPPYKI